MTKKINYIKGDATQPIGSGVKVITHVCNSVGGWGAGFVVALSRRWPQPESSYRNWFKNRSVKEFKLGEVQLVQVEEEVFVANIIGQEGIGWSKGIPPVRYEAIRQALSQVRQYCITLNASVHMPLMGAGLAGGEWSEIEKIVEEELCEYNIPVTTYLFE
jgi:O-acetyl-ADP-ribose deacetylase (regulator of RNase III)